MTSTQPRLPTSRSRRLAQIITAAAFVLLYFPLLIMVIYSFIDNAPQAPSLMTLRWYQMALDNERTLAALKVSLFVGVCSTLGATALGTLGALAMTRARFIGKNVFSA